MYARSFGVFFGSRIKSLVAVEARRLLRPAGVGAVAEFESMVAMTPQTCGAAIEVPEMVLMAYGEPIQVEVMEDPGAKMLEQIP